MRSSAGQKSHFFHLLSLLYISFFLLLLLLCSLFSFVETHDYTGWGWLLKIIYSSPIVFYDSLIIITTRAKREIFFRRVQACRPDVIFWKVMYHLGVGVQR